MIPRPGIYLITPEKINLELFLKQLEEALSTNCITYVQLRLKNCTDEVLLESASALLRVTKNFEIPLIINDRPDIVKQVGGDGVHLGQNDSSVKKARNLLGKNSIIGVTCHDSISLACEAVNSGADYIAFGAFFESISKKIEYFADISILDWWKKISKIPCVAIGGISIDNFQNLYLHGATDIAVISSVWKHPKGPAFAINQYSKKISLLNKF